MALVTGASRGIGAATAEEFARRGHNVAIAARSEEALEAVARRVRELGGDALVCAGDLADLAFAESTVRQTADRWGRLDVLVNNAAWRELVTMRQITLESWERTLRVCLTTPAFSRDFRRVDSSDGDISGTPLRRSLNVWVPTMSSRITRCVQRSPSTSDALAIGQNCP